MSTSKQTEVRKTGLGIEDTWATKTIEAYKDAAREAGQVLLYSKDSEDFPNDAVGQYEHLKRLQSLAATGKIDTVVTSMSRQLVRTKDKNNKVVTKEYLTIRGEFQATNYRGVPYGVEFLAGKHNRPNVVVNADQRFDPETGKPLRPEKILSGQSAVFTIEIPNDSKRKKIIDSYIGDNDPNGIQFYYNQLGLGNHEDKSDNTFTYQEFTQLSIDELKRLSAKSGGGRSPGYWRDSSGKLHSRDEQ